MLDQPPALACCSGFPNGTDRCIAAWTFKRLYAHEPFADYVVGFKEIRYSPADFPSYEALERFLDFLRGLYEDSKVVLNMRRNASATAASGFFGEQGGWGPLLETTAAWFRQYALARAGTLTVAYEDMFDPSTNHTLAQGLLRLMGQPEHLNITFARLAKVFAGQ